MRSSAPRHRCVMTVTAYSAHGLILSENRHHTGLGDDALLRAERQGQLIRVRRGAYCEASHWNELDARQKYILRIRAVAAAAEKPPVLCRWSAAAVWGMPILDVWPDAVHILGSAATGGRSKNGVTRHPLAGFDGADLGGLRRGVSSGGGEFGGGLASVGCEGGIVERDGLLITGLASTTLDIILDADFAPAVAGLDWALWRKNEFRVGISDVRTALERRAPRYRYGHVEAVLGCGTHLSGSYGEPMARAVMMQLGYPQPELQVKFVDRQGEMFTDYFWRAQGIAGEFDGAAKYMRSEYLGTRTPSEVVWQEKKRDDRLRRQVAGTVRIIWSEVRKPRVLDLMFREAGLRPVPRPSSR